jgi:hypothetical protein
MVRAVIGVRNYWEGVTVAEVSGPNERIGMNEPRAAARRVATEAFAREAVGICHNR